MPYTPNAKEIQAAEFGRELDHIITALNDDKDKGKINSVAINRVCGAINGFLQSVSNPLLFNSPYLRFLLQQCSQYNAHLQSYEINQQQRVEQHPDLNAIVCERAGLVKRKIKVSITSHPGRFRGPVVVDSRYYYNQQDVGTFTQHYHNANLTIGGDTQLSNVRGELKEVCKYVLGILVQEPIGQDKDRYFKADHAQKHKTSLAQFETLMHSIENGEPLSDASLAVLDGLNDFYQPPNVSADRNPAPRVTHIGHATALIQAGVFNIACDPVHFQSGTKGLLGAAAAIAYPRKTEPAIKNTRYPGLQAVWISHNHHDHLCPKSLAAFPKDTLFIVPIGDAQHLNEMGFHNVIEVPDWCQSVKLEDEKSGESMILHALPAKHASNRGVKDYMRSLYMGCLVEHQFKNGQRTLILVSGDTAVLDQQHYQELESFIHQLQTPVSLACIAAGPDRPRKYMECTHQSCIDAVVLHAKLTIANLMRKAVSFDTLLEKSCHSIAYHQGCFRLGLLSFTDVLVSITRLYAAIESIQDCSDRALPIDEINPNIQTNIYFNMMDEFERQGLLDLLKEFSRVKIIENGKQVPLTAIQLLQLLATTFHLPKIGETRSSNQKVSLITEAVDKSNLIVNKSAEAKLKSGLSPTDSVFELLRQAGLQYNKISHFLPANETRFLEWLRDPNVKLRCKDLDETENPHKKAQLLHTLLCDLSARVLGPKRFDNAIREEGNFETLILLVAQKELDRYFAPLQHPVMGACSSGM